MSGSNLGFIFFGKGHIYPWWDKVGTGYLIPEKELYFKHSFFYLRSIVAFGALVALQVWYVYTSVRLDVGVTPEYGAGWAANLRAKMRASFILLGPLLARFGRVIISNPGGDRIGRRPDNLHVDAMRALGAQIEYRNGYY